MGPNIAIENVDGKLRVSNWGKELYAYDPSTSGHTQEQADKIYNAVKRATDFGPIGSPNFEFFSNATDTQIQSAVLNAVTVATESFKDDVKVEPPPQPETPPAQETPYEWKPLSFMPTPNDEQVAPVATSAPTVEPSPGLQAAKKEEEKIAPLATKAVASPTRFDKMEETIGGSDLTVWYFQELPNAQDIAKGIPLEICRKEIFVMEFDSVMSISYSTIREKFPVRSLGMINPKFHTSGIRTVSGHIAFSVFTNDVLSRLRGRVSKEVEKNIRTEQDLVGGPPQAKSLKMAQKVDMMKNKEFKSMLLDQLPPFHLLIMGVNERGILSRMLIKGVTILDENQYQGTQQPNIMNKSSFVAIDIVPMTQAAYDDTLLSGSLTAIEESYVGGNYGAAQGKDITGSDLMLDMYYSSIRSNNNLRGTYGH